MTKPNSSVLDFWYIPKLLSTGVTENPISCVVLSDKDSKNAIKLLELYPTMSVKFFVDAQDERSTKLANSYSNELDKFNKPFDLGDIKKDARALVYLSLDLDCELEDKSVDLLFLGEDLMSAEEEFIQETLSSWMAALKSTAVICGAHNFKVVKDFISDATNVLRFSFEYETLKDGGWYIKIY